MGKGKIAPFSHNVFKSCLMLIRQNECYGVKSFKRVNICLNTKLINASFYYSIENRTRSTQNIFVKGVNFRRKNICHFCMNSSIKFCLKNQSVENTGLAFVEGASERNEFFEKINKQ